MNAKEALRNLVGGAGRAPVPVQMATGEMEQHRAVGSVLFAGMSKVGGDLVVTNQRVVFTPLNTSDVSTLVKAGLKLADAPGGATAVIGRLQASVDSAATSLEGIVDVRKGSNGGLVKPPTVIFQLADGRTIEFGVLASRTTLTVSSKNRHARDQLVSALTQ